MELLQKIQLSGAERLAIGEASQALRARLPVERLILFGSKARGTADPESDVDLLVLTSRPLTGEEHERIIDLLYPIQLKHEVWFSPLDVSLDEWEHGVYQALPIRTEVERDGVAL